MLGVFERGGQARLGLESSHGGGVLRVLGRDDLQRDRALEVDVDCFVDDTHPATVEQPFDPITGEDGPGPQLGESRLRALAGVVRHDASTSPV
jgi:hypothetical protein